MSRLSRLKKSNYNNVLYIKEKYKIVDDLDQISFLLNILQREQVSLSVRLYRNIWCSYYSLLSPSSVWSESSSSRTKNLSSSRVAGTRWALLVVPGFQISDQFLDRSQTHTHTQFAGD